MSKIYIIQDIIVIELTEEDHQRRFKNTNRFDDFNEYMEYQRKHHKDKWEITASEAAYFTSRVDAEHSLHNRTDMTFEDGEIDYSSIVCVDTDDYYPIEISRDLTFYKYDNETASYTQYENDNSYFYHCLIEGATKSTRY